MKMMQADVKLRLKSTKPNELNKWRFCLSMTLEEKQGILNRKIDRDISASLFLMRIIRKYLAEHKEELIGERGSTTPTTSSNTLLVNTPATTAGVLRHE